jgi:hypothetical protein
MLSATPHELDIVGISGHFRMTVYAVDMVSIIAFDFPGLQQLSSFLLGPAPGSSACPAN